VTPVCPSLETAVTAYVCDPRLVVLRDPSGAEAPFESMHDAIPGA
jgi:hypothetical protein